MAPKCASCLMQLVVLNWRKTALQSILFVKALFYCFNLVQVSKVTGEHSVILC
jgi:hypothetical protein